MILSGAKDLLVLHCLYIVSFFFLETFSGKKKSRKNYGYGKKSITFYDYARQI